MQNVSSKNKGVNFTTSSVGQALRQTHLVQIIIFIFRSINSSKPLNSGLGLFVTPDMKCRDPLQSLLAASFTALYSITAFYMGIIG